MTEQTCRSCHFSIGGAKKPYNNTIYLFCQNEKAEQFTRVVTKTCELFCYEPGADEENA